MFQSHNTGNFGRQINRIRIRWASHETILFHRLDKNSKSRHSTLHFQYNQINPKLLLLMLNRRDTILSCYTLLKWRNNDCAKAALASAVRIRWSSDETETDEFIIWYSYVRIIPRFAWSKKKPNTIRRQRMKSPRTNGYKIRHQIIKIFNGYALNIKSIKIFTRIWPRAT